ncbi:hypothetical protein [Rhodococcus phenolicus]|uniref:hypothetical protein n=1 Tax=Rhodococcus phenolicus TaxID=263849 RepID=UPI001FE21ABE|nr:hypothetical protein [Rhodococcus phenolicus]
MTERNRAQAAGPAAVNAIVADCGNGSPGTAISAIVAATITVDARAAGQGLVT